MKFGHPIWQRCLSLSPWALAGTSLGCAYVAPWNALSAVLTITAALVLATIYIRENRPGYWGPFVFGVGVNVTNAYWFPMVVEKFSGYSSPVCMLIVLLYVGLMSLQFVAMNWLYLRLHRGIFRNLLLSLPSAWFVLELFFPRMFPWLLANPIIGTPLAQTADLFGTQFTGWILLWLSSMTVAVAYHWRTNPPAYLPSLRLSVSIAGSLAALILIYAGIREHQLQQAIVSAEPLRIAMVQGNLDPIRDFIDHRIRVNVEKYRVFSRDVVHRTQPDLLIWPESSVGFDYLDGERYIERGGTKDPIPGLRVPIIFGGQTRVPRSEAGGDRFYNSAYLMHASGELEGPYRKQVLFPFSEKFPMGDVFPSLPTLFGRNYRLLSGPDEKPLELKLADGRSVKIVAGICYEDLWPDVYASMIRKHGGDLILALSNDNWFMRSAASRQHHLMAAWRAIETRRYLLRATNNGLTAVVDPLGRTVDWIEPFKHGALMSNKVRLLQANTLFVHVGQRPAQGAALIVIAFALFWREPYRKPARITP